MKKGVSDEPATGTSVPAHSVDFRPPLRQNHSHQEAGVRSILSIALSILLVSPLAFPQQPQMYKLTIVDNAGTQKRVKKGRVSSQAVVKVTDQNDVPVAGIAVL